MRDAFLFVLAPRIGVLSALLAVVVHTRRIQRSGVDIGRMSDLEDHGRPDRVSVMWRLSITVIALAHLVAFASPGVMLIWNREPLRLVVLEVVGWIAGAVALGSFVAHAARRPSSSPGGRSSSLPGVASATVLLIAIASGLATAVMYRWASYWSAVTLTPYLHSLFGSDAREVLVTAMPAPVKLHVFAAFALVGLLPWTTAARAVLERAWQMWRADVRTIRAAWATAADLLRLSRRPGLTAGAADTGPSNRAETLSDVRGPFSSDEV